MSKKGKVLVAMSGGIDSTIAALILKDEGYEVVGITMKTWDYAACGGGKKETGCCNIDSFNDARQVAVEHGFSHRGRYSTKTTAVGVLSLSKYPRRPHELKTQFFAVKITYQSDW